MTRFVRFGVSAVLARKIAKVAKKKGLSFRDAVRFLFTQVGC